MTANLSIAGLILASLSIAADETPGSVEGSVTNSITGEAMSGVHVYIRSGVAKYGTVTNEEGHFSLKAVAADKYMLAAEAAQFLLARSENFEIRPGDLSTGHELKLIPQAVIAGRVTDHNGDPVEHALVEAIRGETSSTHRTDANGEFRISGLRAGKYKVHAIPSGSAGGAPEIRTDGSEEDYYGETWYPNSRAESGAGVVETRAGAEARGIDIQLARAPIVRVSGIITGVPKGADGPHLERIYRDRSLGAQVFSGNRFELWRLPPGKTQLLAYADLPGGETVHSAPVEIDVEDSNIDHLELTMMPDFEIAGRVDWDTGCPHGELGEDATIELWAAGEEGGMPRIHSDSPDGDIDSTGAFIIQGVAPDRYRVKIDGMPEDAWVKTVRLGPREMPDRILDLTRGPEDGLVSVTLSMTGARASGMVVDSKSQPAPDSAVTLIGADGRREGHTDAHGAYSFRGLAPGSYKLLAGADEEAAEKIEVHESDQISRDLKIQ